MPQVILVVVFLVISGGMHTALADEHAAHATAAEPEYPFVKPPAKPQEREPLYMPLIERYILDELRAVRIDLQQFQADIERRMADSRLDISDRALSYVGSTMNNFFIIITVIGFLMGLVGWNSLRELRAKTESLVGKRVDEITKEYEERLVSVETMLRERTSQIIATQENIAKTNEIHSLWMRAGLETNPQNRIEMYDEIQKISREDAEVFAYKADAVLELGESEWAVNLSTKALELDPNYGYAYWQLACAHAELGNEAVALENLILALEKSPQLKNDIDEEKSFDAIKTSDAFKTFMDSQV